MNRFILFFLGLFCSLLCKADRLFSLKDTNYWVNYVNPMIGTSGDDSREYGGTMPLVTKPFGMTHWTPMTRENQISRCSYHYNDPSIMGFMGTHQPAIWMGDYGFMSVMPQTGQVNFKPVQRSMPYSHSNEVAKPYYYRVQMGQKANSISTKLTSSTRCSFFAFTFPKNKNAYLSIEMSRLMGYTGYIKIIPEKNRIVGYNPDRHNEAFGNQMGPQLEHFSGYFVLEFDTPFASFGTYSDTSHAYATQDDVKVFEGRHELKGDKIGGYIAFPQNTTRVKLRIGSSFISIEQAAKNLEKEIPEWNFSQTVKVCRKTWEDHMKRIKVEGGTNDQKVNFYTSLYHALLYPRIFSEYGRYYSAFDDQVHEGVAYNDFSLWDTFRALHPLLLFVAPERVNDMITSLVNMYKEGGWLPKWPNPTYTNIMIGTHADAVIADAYVKGFRDFDTSLAYEAMYKNAMVPPDDDKNQRWEDRADWTSYEARGGLSWYKQLGYVPADKTSESVSRTLEFAYDDFCVAQMAKAMDKQEDYHYFMERSKNYRHVYNPEAGFMQPKLANGTFYTGDPGRYNAFTEGSPWTYLFCAMQDVDGLIELMGGKQAFVKRLDENFEGGHYRHDNEPGHHYIYLYNYVDQHRKTQQKVKRVLTEKYKNQPDGLCGNDDCGQMSAWYIFSSMGFYPVTPGTEEYAIGVPSFRKVTIQLREPYDSTSFVIRAKNKKPQNQDVHSIKLDGKKLAQPFIKHSDFVTHDTLVFEMRKRKK